MIDTIVLLIPSHQFKIVQPHNFMPSADLVFNGAVIKATQFPSKHGIFKPRLTISRRMNLHSKSEIMLTIELSLPKLLFGNNVAELRYKDFDTVTHKLHHILNDMGIEMNLEDLQQADVTTIHYAKNIVLTNGATPFHFIQKIKQANIASRLDSNQTDYRNAGQSFKWHCKGYEIVFYDKLAEIAKTNDGQKIIKIMRKKHKMFEMLRMEVRLNKRHKIKQLFATLGIKSDLTLRKLFKPVIMRKVLLHYINVLEQKRLPILHFTSIHGDKTLLATMIVNNPTLTPKQIVQYFGFKKIVDEITIDEFKKMLPKSQERNWQRLIKELQDLQIPQNGMPFDIIKKQIEKYKPLKLF